MNIFLESPEFEDIYIKGMNIDLHLITKGDKNGIPLIFIPGITSYSYSFAELLRKIPHEFYCLSLDVRGRGQSSWPEKGYKLHNYVDDLLNVINYIIGNQHNPIIIGHSMGARIGVAFASQYSNLISGMVLIDPPINGPGQRDVYPNPLDEMFLKQKSAVDEGKMDLFRKLMPEGWTERQILQRANEYRNNSRNAIIESYQSLLYEPFHAQLKNVNVPMLLLAAELGDTIRENELELIKDLNPLLKAERIKDVGHMIYKDNPDIVAHRIVGFANTIKWSSERHEINNN
ncbi:alpha/beta fold hydrolase [Sporosarcina aquimarina]|uniref:alpha/beta fold hydrolase n=1 Tax=Sporosarcina aquimarina TaxID=114975 RepID=UPI001C8EB83D|nr:alpha/beta hydrolase [Sporosarcina aquimarina]MBY0221401.1 alpha/beta hydrolase [Sporosarcina aquimarina]